ncbi:uncharacterized protein BDCG_01318 [Blastomyces dermatitidis ER-3]|uniref:Uncharacterized protein n=1 Tax=Ajellomyces dermatitidis (strain ER-3 / ATCC MYA-2586) TaxID=559297 RepID=A0ABP2ESI8_AJEDR|nr:uncharacterized protein BDCG_01318 [Blastomyces dermatitidis ER-3]EEQ84513.1 hypothetical protein BDCG_01318 [Blastomyces dermatitidis ER-3]
MHEQNRMKDADWQGDAGKSIICFVDRTKRDFIGLLVARLHGEVKAARNNLEMIDVPSKWPKRESGGVGQVGLVQLRLSTEIKLICGSGTPLHQDVLRCDQHYITYICQTTLGTSSISKRKNHYTEHPMRVIHISIPIMGNKNHGHTVLPGLQPISTHHLKGTAQNRTPLYNITLPLT